MILAKQIFKDWSINLYDNSIYDGDGTIEKKGYSVVVTHFDSFEMQDINEETFKTKEQALNQFNHLIRESK